MSQPIEANITSVESVVSVTAAMGSAGQALASVASSSIRLARGYAGGPIEFQVSGGGWTLLDRNQGVDLPVDLSKTSVLVRKATTTSAPLRLHLTVRTAGAVSPEGGVPIPVGGSTGPASALTEAEVAALQKSLADPRMIATHRADFYWNTTTAANNQTDLLTATVHYSPPWATYDYRFFFPGWFINGNPEQNIGNDVFYRGVSVEMTDVKGVVTRYPCTVVGSTATSFTVPDGGGVWLQLDPSIVIPPNSQWRQIVCVSGAVGTRRGSGCMLNPTFGPGARGLVDGIMLSGGDLSSYLTGTAAITANGGSYYAPSAAIIVARGWKAGGKKAVVFGVGDSIQFGANDGGPRVDGVYGVARRALADRTNSEFIPYCGSFFSGAGSANASNFAKRQQAMADAGFPYTTIFHLIGANLSGTSAVMLDNFTAGMNYLRDNFGGRRIVNATAIPYTVAIDPTIGMATAANQNPRSGGSPGPVLNPAIRSGMFPGQSAYVEQSLGVVDANRTTDDQAWSAGTDTTLAAAYTAASVTLVTNAAPLLNETLAIGVGTANYSIAGYVINIQPNTPSAGQFTVTLSGATGTLASPVGARVVALNTPAGIHPTPLATMKLAEQVVVPAKKAGLFVNPAM